MKIIVIGGTGTMGKAVVQELKKRHDVISVGKKNGDLQCDIASEDSLKALFSKVGKCDAVAICAGDVQFEELSKLKSSHFQSSLNHKLMGQINTVLIGLSYINDNGSFTLVSGILSEDPAKTGICASTVNGAINSFVIGAAIEMPRGIRINAVSPTLMTESVPVYGSYFPGFEPVPAAKVALAYVKSIEGSQTGQIYPVGYA